MVIKLALLDPRNGQYQFFADVESAKAAFFEMSQELFLEHTHQTPFSQVTENDDGTQTWSATDYKEIIK